MRNIIVIVIAVLLIGGAVAYKSLSSSPNGGDNDHATPASEITAKLPDGVKIFDVRTDEEYKAGHVKNAQLLPDYDIAAGKYPKLAKDAPIAVYCRSGNRSAGAAANLRKAGFTNVTDLGGLDSLYKYGLQIKQ